MTISRHALSVLSVVALTMPTACVSLPDFLHRGDGHATMGETGSCVNLAPENQLHPVGACDQGDVYRLIAPGREIRVAGPMFRTRLRERLAEFVRSTPYPIGGLLIANIEVWLVAPAFRPEEAHLVAVVLGRAGNFAVRLDLDPDLWTVEPASVLWLGEESYPTQRAKRTGLVRVSGQGWLKAGELAAFVGGAQAGAIEDQGHALLLRTGTFGEQVAMARLAGLAGASRYVARAELVAAKEADGGRAVVFRFPMRGE